jgi:hypothetical protein
MMNRRIPIAVLLVATLVAPSTFAADAKPPLAPVPAPPPVPEKSSGESPPAEVPETGLDPEVTITTKGTEIREEYRVNGKLFKIKVTPAHGKPYYLIDYEGSGVFRRSELEPGVSVPLWVIKSW